MANIFTTPPLLDLYTGIPMGLLRQPSVSPPDPHLHIIINRPEYLRAGFISLYKLYIVLYKYVT